MSIRRILVCTYIIYPVAGLICPVKDLLRYIEIRCHKSPYLFCHVNGKSLIRFQFGAVLSKCVNQLQLPSRNYRTHSFRIGAATWLSSRGVSDSIIKQMGRWKSDAFKKYIVYPIVNFADPICYFVEQTMFNLAGPVCYH